MTPEPTEDLDLIRDTISDLNDSLGRIEAQIEALQTKHAEVAKRRDAWRKRLNPADVGDATRQRAPKGENDEKVFAFLDRQANAAGYTITEVAAGAGIGASSARSVLRGNQDKYECVGSSRWVIRGKHGRGGN